MKVTNLRRKLAAALAAAGMLAPSYALAADLNINLLINGDFENVDLGSPAPNYNAPRILDWSGANAFAYSHPTTVGQPVDYAEGDDPPSAGNWYFTSNNAGAPNFESVSIANVTAPNPANQFYQDIDVSGGATGSTIASGNAHYGISAWMTSYTTHTDVGRAHLDFLDGGGTSLGTALLSDSDAGPNNVWSLEAATGAVPIGTATVRLSLYGTYNPNCCADGYIDNVGLLISDQPILPTLSIAIDRDTGVIVLKNQTGSPVNLSGYTITSAFEGVAPDNWLSIAENYDMGSPGPNQFDPAHEWTEQSDPNLHADLTETDFSGVGATLAHGETINLSNISGAWIRSATEDLDFQYTSNFSPVNGIVVFSGNDDSPFAVGDINTDGLINAADWVILRNNQHQVLISDSFAEAYRAGDLNGDKLNNHADFVLFKNAYEAANGAGSFAAMVNAVPEPSTVILLGVAGLFVLPLARRRSNER